MQGTNALPIERGDNRTITNRNGFESSAIRHVLTRAFKISGLTIVRISCRLASSVLLVAGTLQTQLQARRFGRTYLRTPSGAASPNIDRLETPWGTGQAAHAMSSLATLLAPRAITISDATPDAVQHRSRAKTSKLIVIGFMGGNVRPNNFVHREAKLTQMLQTDYPATIHAQIFANRHGQQAFESVLQQLAPGGALLTGAEKSAARIVIFGHSWGGSETVALAKRLNRVGIPVLLTIQVDSVQKKSQNDAQIPPNVREAVNFYQAEGMLRGRDKIVAADPEKTAILGNFESSYRKNAISVAEFPWYARAFMKPHVQIENDPTVWNKIQSLILAQIR